MRNWGGTWLDSLTRLLSVYGWGCGHLKTRMGLQGPCHGWLLSRSLRAPLRNARVSSGQGFRLQPELLIQGRSSECLKASLRSPAVTLPQCWLVRDQPRLMPEGPEHGDEEPQVALEAGALVTHVRCIGPFLIWKSLRCAGATDVCALSLQSYITLCNLMDCRPPGSSVHRICQAKMLEWVAMPSSRWSSWPRDGASMSLNFSEESLKSSREIIWCVILKKVYFYSVFCCL